MKDTEHIDPITYNQIGVYYRGTFDAPQKITFFREAESQRENREENMETEDILSDTRGAQRTSRSGRRGRQEGRRSSRHSHVSHNKNQRSVGARFHNGEITITNEPIEQQIIFRDKPVLLPDGVSYSMALINNSSNFFQ